MAASESTPQVGRTARFLSNVLWSWLGVGINIFAGFILTPFIIRRLGDHDFGVWTVVLSLVEYYWLLDFGFRQALVKYSAHYRALDRPDDLNRVLNTGMMYSSVVGAVMLLATVFGRGVIARRFETDQATFSTLLLIVGTSWSLGTVFNVFSAGLEGFQRYDLTSRIWILSTGIRVIGIAILVALGFGLKEMAMMLLASQVLIYILTYFAFRKAFPPLRVSPALAGLRTLKEMSGFAFNTFTISIAQRILSQSTPLMIGTMIGLRFTGYYTVPQRLLEYAADGVSRFGMVAGTTAAELTARKEWRNLAELSIWANRYCFTLYMFLVIYLIVYGSPLMTIWIKPEFAAHSAILLPILLLGVTAMNSQYSSACVLVNMGKQKGYARALMVEALLSVAGVWLVIPRFGLVGVAYVVSTLMFLNRGVFCSWLLSRAVHIGYWTFVSRIYGVPLAISTVVLGFLWTLRTRFIPGTSLVQLASAAIIGGTLYALLAFLFGLRTEHRHYAISLVRRQWDRLRGVKKAPVPA